jgi:hypothetical protein
LAENAIRGRIARAGSWIERSQRLIEFEHAWVAGVGDEQVANPVDRQTARRA